MSFPEAKQIPRLWGKINWQVNQCFLLSVWAEDDLIDHLIRKFFFSLCMSMILILTMIKSQLVKCHISPSLSDRMRWTVKCQQARASGHLISHRFSYNQMSGKTAPHTPLTYQPLCVSLTHSTMTVFFFFLSALRCVSLPICVSVVAYEIVYGTC